MPRHAGLGSLLLALAIGCAGPDPANEAIRESATPVAHFLVLNKVASSVGFYTLDGELLEAVPVGKHPHEMILSADARTAYVTNYGAMAVEVEALGGDTVSIIDIESRTPSGEILLGENRRPHGIDLDRSSGRIAVSTENPNRLLIIDPGTRRILSTFDTQGQASHMVTLSPDGHRAYVSNIVSRNVSAIDLESGHVELVSVRERPEGSVITQDGRILYVANRESHFISIMDTQSNAVVGEIPTGKGPNRVRLSNDEALLIYSLVHDRKIGFADVAGRRELATVDVEGSPVSLQVSADGQWAFTAVQDTDTVYVISVPERRIAYRFKTPDGSGPDPVLHIHSAGRLLFESPPK